MHQASRILRRCFPTWIGAISRCATASRNTRSNTRVEVNLQRPRREKGYGVVAPMEQYWDRCPVSSTWKSGSRLNFLPRRMSSSSPGRGRHSIAEPQAQSVPNSKTPWSPETSLFKASAALYVYGTSGLQPHAGQLRVL